MRVLGIETSCDETGIAIFDEKEGLLAHALHSQIDTHAPYGGVVPELASRDHSHKLLTLLQDVLKDSKVPLDSINAIAYTAGPGLVGALLVGATFAKTLAYALKIPAIAVHHMEAHLLAALLETPAPQFPFLALLVSGGHTLLIEVYGVGHYKILGETLDDAAGEAFDKTAKLLGLPYPGGPALAALAESGNPNRFNFPRPLTEKSGLEFSFSGLKTHTITTYKKTAQSEQDKADIAKAFEDAVVDTLFIKCKRALQTTALNRLVVAGGVGANRQLRIKLKTLETDLKCTIYYPRLEFCTDNGAMIAFAGYQHFKHLKHLKIDKFHIDNPLEILVHPRWSMEVLAK